MRHVTQIIIDGSKENWYKTATNLNSVCLEWEESV